MPSQTNLISKHPPEHPALRLLQEDPWDPHGLGTTEGDMKAAQGPLTPLLSLKGVSSPLSSWLQGDQPCGDKILPKPREQQSREEP